MRAAARAGARSATPALRSRASLVGPADLARATDGARAARGLIALQATAGNAAVQRLLDLAVQRQDDGGAAAEQEVALPPLTGQGQPADVAVEGGCDGLSLHGQTNATFNGGRWSVARQRVTAAASCDSCPPGTRCLHLTGTLVATYSASVSISMPPVPSGLTPCEAGQVRTFLRTVLLPHEQDHERRFKTYDGTTRTPLDLIGCSQDDLTQQIAAMQAAEDAQRQAAANALSGAIDPFSRTVDCSSCDG